tara:strand:- start:17658 stop:19466 length:1809 start_codon:yes stop_codon:yes gene_type:complete
MCVLYQLLIYLLFISSFIYPCRLWCIISIDNQSLTENQSDLNFIIDEANYFQELGTDYNSWSLFYYNQDMDLENIYRSNMPANSDTAFQIFLDQSLNQETDTKILAGHLRAPTSGAVNIINPHPFLFYLNNKTYSLMHNGTLDKTILISLLTNNNSDSTWINNNPPNTFNDENWNSDSGWVNIVDSELLLLWIMQNIEMSTNSELESILNSIQELEIIHPHGDKNFIFSDGDYIYAYRSEDDELSDLYYSDLTSISVNDSIYNPNFISIMSQIPTTVYASQLNWNTFENETLMVVDNQGNFNFINNFINHPPQLESCLSCYNYWILNDYSIFLNATDIDGDSLSFSINNNPEWILLENQTLYVYPEELGSFTFEVTISDGEFDETYNMIIDIVEFRPIINSINDIPDDDGGWVDINFSKSFFDNNDNSVIYDIQRFSDGDWLSIDSLNADGSEIYILQVETEIDSSYLDLGLTFFRVEASMNEVIYISEIDTGYSVNNNYLKSKDISSKVKYFSLSQNHPNPFNALTNISYNLPEDSHVKITIYDLMGNIVKEIIDQSETSGFKSVQWNGMNDKGKLVSSGTYIFGIESNKFIKQKKMIFLK